LVILTLVYALSIADRYVMSTLIEPIKAALHLSDSAIGFLTGVALAIFYVTAGLPLATLADRANRRTLIALALSLPLMFLIHSVQRDEEALVIDCQQYCLEHLVNRLYEPDAAAGEPTRGDAPALGVSPSERPRTTVRARVSR